MNISLTKGEVESLEWILSMFVDTHKPDESGAYVKDLEVCDSILSKIIRGRK